MGAQETGKENHLTRKEKAESIMHDGSRNMMRVLLICAILLIAIGWVMLLDTGLIYKGAANPEYFQGQIIKRIATMSIGGIFLLALWLLPPKTLRILAIPSVIIAIGLLALLWTPLGAVERDCRRWLNFGPFRFQPLEFAKLALVWFLAFSLSKPLAGNSRDVKRLMLPAGIGLLMVGLVGMQPNLSGAFFLIILALVMAVLGGVNRRFIFSMVCAGAISAAALLSIFDSRHDRFLPMFKPLADLSGKGYQVAMSLWAITSGGITGRGPGESIAMYSLPDHSTDFIFSILVEEWGMIGGFAVIALFAILVYAGFRISLAQNDPFRCYLGCGVTSIIGIQAAINMGVVLALLPTTGVPLPFVSIGGSNLILSLVSVGILMNLGRRPNEVTEIRTTEPSADKHDHKQRVKRVRVTGNRRTRTDAMRLYEKTPVTGITTHRKRMAR